MDEKEVGTNLVVNRYCLVPAACKRPTFGTGTNLFAFVTMSPLSASLPVPRREVQFDEAHQYSEDNGLIHMETSAKSALNVKSIFVEIGESGEREDKRACRIWVVRGWDVLGRDRNAAQGAVKTRWNC